MLDAQSSSLTPTSKYSAKLEHSFSMDSENKQGQKCGGSPSSQTSHQQKPMQQHTHQPDMHPAYMSSHQTMSRNITINLSSHLQHRQQYTTIQSPHAQSPYPQQQHPPLDPLLGAPRNDPPNITAEHMTCHPQKTSLNIYTALWGHQ
jgi:hypothetical protein